MVESDKDFTGVLHFESKYSGEARQRDLIVHHGVEELDVAPHVSDHQPIVLPANPSLVLQPRGLALEGLVAGGDVV